MNTVLQKFNLRFKFRKETEQRKHRGTVIERPMFDAEMSTLKGVSRPTWIFRSYWNQSCRNPYLAIRNGLRENEFQKWTPEYK